MVWGVSGLCTPLCIEGCFGAALMYIVEAITPQYDLRNLETGLVTLKSGFIGAA